MKTCPCRTGSHSSFVHDLLPMQIALAGASIFTGRSPGSPDLTPDQCLYLRFLLAPGLKFSIIFELRRIYLLLIAQLECPFIEVPNLFIIALYPATFSDSLKQTCQVQRIWFGC